MKKVQIAVLFSLIVAILCVSITAYNDIDTRRWPPASLSWDANGIQCWSSTSLYNSSASAHTDTDTITDITIWAGYDYYPTPSYVPTRVEGTITYPVANNANLYLYPRADHTSVISLASAAEHTVNGVTEHTAS